MSDVSLPELAAAYARLSSDSPRKRHFPKLQATTVTIQSRLITNLDTIERVVTALENLEGWSRRTSWAGRTPLDAARREPGAPLDGEWCQDGTTSLRLFYDVQGWHLVTVTENGQDGTPVLREDLHLAARPGRAGPIRYAVYWDIPTDSGIRRFACRLLGFGDTDR